MSDKTVFVSFELNIHGLDATKEEVLEIQNKILKYVKSIHPHLRFEDDVEIEIWEYAGGDLEDEDDDET